MSRHLSSSPAGPSHAVLILGLLLGCGDKGEDIDSDGDGVFAHSDCDDDDASVGAAAVYHPDADGDGYGSDRSDLAVEACSPPAGYLDSGDDCDDTEATVHPGGDEVCDGHDNDCDGDPDEADEDLDTSTLSTFYRDADGDGYGETIATKEACLQPSGYVALDGDCDDTDRDATPETSWPLDQDGDGYGDPYQAAQACEQPPGTSTNDDDCDDLDPTSYPGGNEVCDDADNDCDGLIDDEDSDLDIETGTAMYPDVDGDGYGDEWGTPELACNPPEGYAANAGDCDDTTTDANPDQTEVCDDGLDNDCSGSPDSCGLSGEVLASESDARFTGIDDGDYLGYSVAVVPDLDGDGADELLMGAPGVDENGSASGAVYLLPGSSSFSGEEDVDELTTFHGDDGLEYVGRAVAAADDVDGDGIADLLIGGAGYADVGSTQGRVALFYGAADLSGSWSLNDADASFEGAEAGDHAGYGVSAGDLDGDGLSDLLMGAKYAKEGPGAVYLVYGSASLGGTASLADSAAAFVGEDTYDYVGERWSTTVADDLDGDGIDDLCVGAYGGDGSESGQGEAWVFLGSSDRYEGDAIINEGDLEITGSTSLGRLGYNVQGMGDLDGDGYGELVVSAYTANESLGEVYVYRGGASAWSGTKADADADVIFVGAEDNAYAGRSLAVGDIDGDDHPDLAVGAYAHNDGNAEQVGQVFVLYARGTWSGTYELATEADATFNGEDTTSYVGWSLASGDLDGDGDDDLAVGSYRSASSTEDNAGIVHLLLGGGY